MINSGLIQVRVFAFIHDMPGKKSFDFEVCNQSYDTLCQL